LGGLGCGFALAGLGDDAEELELGDGGAGDEDALGVGAGVGRGYEETCAFNEGAVVGGEAFELFAVVEGHAQPDAGVAGFGGEAAAQKALRVGAFAGRELADGADPFDLIPADSVDFAGGVQELELGGCAEIVSGSVTSQPLASKLAYNHGFASNCHAEELSHGLG